jgi:predicted permease
MDGPDFPEMRSAMFTALFRDMKHGVRQLARQPGFTAAAVASLALGIGLNTTLFSMVNAVLFRSGPVAQPDRLVEIYSGMSEDFPQFTTSYPDYLDIRSGVDALAGVNASSYVRGILSTGDRPALVTGEAVTANYFDVLGVRLSMGRSFREEENLTPGAASVAVLGHGLWQQRFGSRPDTVGSSVKISGVSYTVIGIAPREFTGTIPGIPADFWAPLVMVDRLVFSGVQGSTDKDPGATRIERRGTRWLFVKGRLAEGRTVDQVQAQMDALYARLRADYPDTNEKTTASVVPAASIRFHPMLDTYIRAASAGLMAAVALVLLIACANVANMLLARGASRRRELAIRAALGASRARLIRQLLSEGLVLAFLGGAAGILIAWWAGRALSGFGSELFPIPISFDFSVDWRVLAFAFTASAATAILFGLAPAWSSSKPALVPALKESAEGNGRRRLTLRNLLVVGQLSLSLVLLVAGALLGRGLLAARNTELGFDPTPISSLSFDLRMNGYDIVRATALRERILDTVAALPGVMAVSTASRLPLAPDINLEGVLVPGHHLPKDEGTLTDVVAVGADYFTVVGVPIVKGRPISADDVRQQRRVAVVNETMARQYWPEGAAIGRLIHAGGWDSAPVEIVGVARDHKVRSVGEQARPYLHLPVPPSQSIGLIVRTATPAAAALPMLRDAIWKLDPEILFTEDVPAEQVAAATIAPTRLGAMVLGAFGALALLLAAVGLYGVISHAVGRRTRELGIRIALGAERGQVLRMIMAEGGRLALAGIGLGTLAAAAIGRVLESLLYGVSSFDPIAYSVAAGLLFVVALAANLVPALTAASIDPVRALRTE